MSRIYGARYGQTAHLDLPAVARLIRADLKTAAAGDGPLKGLKFSVRLDRFAGGVSIDIAVDGLTDAEILHVDRHGNHTRTARANAVRDATQAVADAYNWDGSDHATDHFDVRFYSSVSLVTDDERTYRASMAALKTSRTTA